MEFDIPCLPAIRLLRSVVAHVHTVINTVHVRASPRYRLCLKGWHEAWGWGKVSFVNGSNPNNQHLTLVVGTVIELIPLYYEAAKVADNE